MTSAEPAEGGSPDQWRIDFAQRLAGYTLHRRRYTRRSETWDHDHCAACFAMFAEFDGDGILHEGYTTGLEYPLGADYDWVCPTCFTELASALG